MEPCCSLKQQGSRYFSSINNTLCGLDVSAWCRIGRVTHGGGSWKGRLDGLDAGAVINVRHTGTAYHNARLADFEKVHCLKRVHCPCQKKKKVVCCAASEAARHPQKSRRGWIASRRRHRSLLSTSPAHLQCSRNPYPPEHSSSGQHK